MAHVSTHESENRMWSTNLTEMSKMKNLSRSRAVTFIVKV